MAGPPYEYDVFLSYCAKDKPIVRDVAARLREDGLKVWFDEWAIKAGDSIPSKVEYGLKHSRVLVLCMSANAFGSDWSKLEAGTFQFRDPLNKQRRFIPLRLDDAPIEGTLAQFRYIDWLPASRALEYVNLRDACRQTAADEAAMFEHFAMTPIQLDHAGLVHAYAFSPDGKRVLTAGDDKKVRLWDLELRRCLLVYEGHAGPVRTVAWSVDQRQALAGGDDQAVRLWDVDAGRCLRELRGRTAYVWKVTLSPDGRLALHADANEVRVWDLQTGKCERVLVDGNEAVRSFAWSADQLRAASGCSSGAIRLWSVVDGRCLRVLAGHTGEVWSLALSSDGRRAVSGSWDKTVRVWDLEAGHCLRVLEGHTNNVYDVCWSADERLVLSCSADLTIRLWEPETGRCHRVFNGHEQSVRTLALGADGRRAFSGDISGGIRSWDLSDFVTGASAPQR